MPVFLESGKLRLTAEEVEIYRTAADRLRVASEMALDITQPVSVDDWILLQVAQGALAGNVAPLDDVIAAVESAIRSRAKSI